MNDTPAAVEARFRDMLMSRSGEERLHMGFDMFDSARTLVLASLAEVPESERKQQLFIRTYGSDFGVETTARILACLKERTAQDSR